MRRHMREYLALTAGLLLGLTAVFPGHADSVAYDVSGGLLDPSSYRQVDFADGQRHLIYPGDSIAGLANIYLAEDGNRQEMPEAQDMDLMTGALLWKNTSGNVYEVLEITPVTSTTDENGLPVTAPGTYELDASSAAVGMAQGAVCSGISGTDQITPVQTEAFYPDLTVNDPNGIPQPLSVTGYSWSQGDLVTLSVDPAAVPEGQVFTGWQVQYVDENNTLQPANPDEISWQGLSNETVTQENLTFSIGKADHLYLFTPLFGMNTGENAGDQQEGTSDPLMLIENQQEGSSEYFLTDADDNMPPDGTVLPAEGWADPSAPAADQVDPWLQEAGQEQQLTAEELAAQQAAAEQAAAEQGQQLTAEELAAQQAAAEQAAAEQAAAELAAQQAAAEQAAAEQAAQQAAAELAAAELAAQQAAAEQQPAGNVIISYYPEGVAESSASLIPWTEGLAGTVSTSGTLNGQVFAYWKTSDPEAVQFADASAATTGYSVSSRPASDVEISPVYVSVYSVSVSDGTAAYDAAAGQSQLTGLKAGTIVTVTAARKEGYTFAGWNVTEAPEGFGLDDPMRYASSFSFAMPEGNVAFSAAYNEIIPETYSVTVSEGSAFASETGAAASAMKAGESVTVNALQKEGFAFTGWTVTDAGGSGFALSPEQAAAASVTFAMPAANISLAANYAEIPAPVYSVTVLNQDPNTSVSLVSGGNAYDSGTAFPAGTPISIVTAGSAGRCNVAVTDQNGNPLQLDANEEYHTYSFVVPESSVTVTVTQAVRNVKGLQLKVYGKTSFIYGGQDTGVTGGEVMEDGSVCYTVSTDTAEYATVVIGAAPSDEQVSVTLDNIQITPAEDGSFIFSIQADSTVILSYVKNTHTVNTDNCAADPAVYAEGDLVTLVPHTAPEGYTFAGFTVTDIYGNEVELAQKENGTVTLTAPPADLIASANYVPVSKYGISVSEGTIVGASGEMAYKAGDQVTIEANQPQEGYSFRGWSVVSGDAVIADASQPTTTITVGNSASTVAANYAAQTYKVIVEGGSGSGNYGPDQAIPLQGDYPPSGQVFDSWMVEKGEVQLSDAASLTTTGYTKSSEAAVKASYKAGPAADDCAVTGIGEGAEYLKGTTLTFTATGAGMDDPSPNPGDWRFLPTGYQISTVSGSWSAAPYTTSMAINATGDYTLTVQFAKQLYNGSSWNSDGSTVSKSVHFHVVNALSVETGDSSPLIPLICAAGAALFVIIILVIILTKRRR